MTPILQEISCFDRSCPTPLNKLHSARRHARELVARRLVTDERQKFLRDFGVSGGVEMAIQGIKVIQT